MRGLRDKVIVVTGGASGLGKAMAERLVTEGCRVVIADIQVDLGREVAAQIGAEFSELDVTDESRWQEIVGDVVSRHGGIHGLVNNAGMTNPPNSDLESARLTDFHRLFEVNVGGTFLGCRAAIRAIAASDGGSIVNISSISGILAMPFAVGYGASKAAVRHLTKSVAQYALERGLPVRCNSVHPGLVRTPPWEVSMARKAAERDIPVEDAFADVAGAVPMGEMTGLDDIAATVAFLLSSDARHITGEQIAVDGGMVHADSFYNTRLTGRR